MARRVAVVPHTHWDREWYRPFPHFRRRLVDLLDDFLPRLEADPSAGPFLLDGQLAVLDDYLAVRPDQADRVRRLAGAGRLSVGPWYILMDEFCVSGETILRNLALGLERADAFGGAMAVGYLPDMFGHVAQMPQILHMAGLHHAVVWRGVPAAVDRSAFWWRAPDGSTVRAEYLPVGYSIGAHLPDDPDDLLRRERAEVAGLRPFLRGESDPVLLLAGTDHEVPRPGLADVLHRANERADDLRFELTTLAAYLADAPTDALPSWSGELRSGARSNLLMGVLSNRVDVKVAAAVAERNLERRAEPLATLWSPEASWPATALGEAWLEVIRNSAHDSVCACSDDDVGLAVLHRYATASAIGVDVAEVALSDAATLLGPGPVVVNALGRTRSGTVEVTVAADRVPDGAQVLVASTPASVERHGVGADLAQLLGGLVADGWWPDGGGTSASVRASTTGLELDLVVEAGAPPSLRLSSVLAEAAAHGAGRPGDPLVIRVERHGAVRALVRVADVPGWGWASLLDTDQGPTVPPVSGGHNRLDNGLVHLEVNPADGTFSINGLAGLGRLVDEGDAGDTYTYSPPSTDVVVERPRSVRVVATETGPVRGRLQVTRTFLWPAALVDGRRVGRREVEVVTDLELRAGERLVRVATTFDNPCRDHRLRAWFPLLGRAERSVAECAFATVTRGLTAEGGPGERGLPTFPSRRFVAAGGVTVTHEGLLEYELVDDGWALALTLVRSTGLISQPAPAYRPNAAGPAHPAAAAQMVGPVSLRYGVAVGDDIDPWALADDAWSPLDVVAGTGVAPARGSCLELTGAEVSSLRRVPGGVEVRVFNPTDEPTVVAVPERSGTLVDLRGRRLAAWAGTFALPAWGIATARLDPAPGYRGPGVGSE